MPKKSPIILKTNVLPRGFRFKTYEDLVLFFKTNLVEVIFRRRILPPYFKKYRETGHASYWRRMLCTSNFKFLFSSASGPYFHLPRPNPANSKGKEYYRKHWMVLTIDIFHKEWRIVSLDKYKIVGYLPFKTDEDKGKFMAFYRGELKNIPENKTLAFQDM